MSAELEVQKAIYNLLKGDTALRALLAVNTEAGSPTEPAVYDYVPQADAAEDDANFPFVGIGDDTAGEADTDDVKGQEHTLTLHIFDRYEGRKRVKQIQGAIYDLLHDCGLLVENHNTVYCLWEFAGSIPDPDPRTQHGVTRFRIVTQQ